MTSNKHVTSIKVNPDLWKEARKYAIDKGISVGELVERLLEKELKNKERSVK